MAQSENGHEYDGLVSRKSASRQTRFMLYSVRSVHSFILELEEEIGWFNVVWWMRVHHRVSSQAMQSAC